MGMVREMVGVDANHGQVFYILDRLNENKSEMPIPDEIWKSLSPKEKAMIYAKAQLVEKYKRKAQEKDVKPAPPKPD
jgi:hypothetical protein